MSDALNGHDGDRAALLQAINEVAQGFGGSNKVSQGEQNSMMKSSNVNQAVARDLVSNAGSKVANLRDFEDRLLSEARDKQSAQAFEHGKTLLENSNLKPEPAKPVEDDLRSLRSEYDYGSKKKFVDVLGNINTTSSQINELRRLHEQNKMQGREGSTRNSNQSISYKSAKTGGSRATKLTSASLAAMKKERMEL